MASLIDHLTITIEDPTGYPRLSCELMPSDTADAASALAAAIAQRRIGGNPRLHHVWETHHDGATTDAVTETDAKLFATGLLQNVGTPEDPQDDRYLHGLIAEAVWSEVISSTDAGLGLPIRTEGHEWSVMDHGGDGLTVYASAEDFSFRLWESKHHGATSPLRDTVTEACRQLKGGAPSYLARFGLIAQYLADQPDLAEFYGRMAELWVDKDQRAGAGITVAADATAEIGRGFDGLESYFGLGLSQHQAALHLLGDIDGFAKAVQIELWRGCGLWTEP